VLLGQHLPIVGSLRSGSPRGGARRTSGPHARARPIRS